MNGDDIAATAWSRSVTDRRSSRAGRSSPRPSRSITSAVRTRLSTVTAIVDLTPKLRQITFGGLHGVRSLGGDEFLYVLTPPPGRSELTVGADFTWDAYAQMADADRPAGAYYTVRRRRPDDGEIDMWFVLHDHPGPASTWATHAEIGSPVALWGPRRSFEPPPEVERHLLVVDESGLAAAASILEQLHDPTDAPPVHVIAETSAEDCTVDLHIGPDTTIEWLHRGDEPAGTGSALLDAVRRLEIDPGTTYAFGAAESRQITSVRTHLRHRVGMGPELVSMTGYWRRDPDRPASTDRTDAGTTPTDDRTRDCTP